MAKSKAAQELVERIAKGKQLIQQLRQRVRYVRSQGGDASELIAQGQRYRQHLTDHCDSPLSPGSGNHVVWDDPYLSRDR